MCEGDESRAPIAEGAVLLRGFATEVASEAIQHIIRISDGAPFRHLIAHDGKPMRVAMTNCGAIGWANKKDGYGYATTDPLTGRPWPAMPDAFALLATRSAAEAGFSNFVSTVCIINRYAIGTGLKMHQDRDDTKDGNPVVSVSFGLCGQFWFGGQGRGVKPRTFTLQHGDVVVWGGPARMSFHGVAPIEAGNHPLTGPYRFNLTFRSARVPRGSIKSTRLSRGGNLEKNEIDASILSLDNSK